MTDVLEKCWGCNTCYKSDDSCKHMDLIKAF